MSERFKIKKRNIRRKVLKFKGITSPKICAICRTEGQIERLESLEWHCKACGYKWNK